MRRAEGEDMSSGVVYDCAHPPKDRKFLLTLAELQSLTEQLAGVPVRIEHEPGRDVGRVTSARLEAGRLVVDWLLDDTPAGWTSARIIEKGIAPELSLQHAVYSDGTVKPLEVSIVQAGARKGCAIATGEYLPASGTGYIMASAAPATDAPMPPPEAADPPASAPAPPASDEPPAKRAKNFETPMDFVNDIKDKVGDADTLQTILDYIAENMDSHVRTQQENAALRQAKELLEQSQKAHVESSKTVVRDIVDCLSSIYQNFGSASMEAPHKEKLTSLLSDNVEAREALRPLLVAASAMGHLKAAVAGANANAAFEAASKKIADLSQKLIAARGMTSHNAPAPVAPQWTAAPAAAPAPTPVVAVAASAVHPADTFTVPAILKTMPYGVGGVGRVTKGDFSRKM